MVQEHRADGAPAPDGDAGHDGVLAEGVLDRRDHAEVQLPCVETLGDTGGHVLLETKTGLLLEPVDERLGVQVRHRSQAQRRRWRPFRGRAERHRSRGAHHSFTTLKTVSRSTGAPPPPRG